MKETKNAPTEDSQGKGEEGTKYKLQMKENKVVRNANCKSGY